MIQIGLTGLCKIELPGYTIRLCDGGRIKWGSETFVARDPEYGTLGSIEEISEGAGEELPPLELTLIPPDTAAAADLVQPTMQGSRVQLWLAEYNPVNSTVIGTPEAKFDGELDQAALTLQLQLTLSIIPAAARLFELNIGNSLSASWHKSIWSGETGHDEATGLTEKIAWGVEAPIGTAIGGGGGGVSLGGIGYGGINRV
jgi:hypothetical protein